MIQHFRALSNTRQVFLHFFKSLSDAARMNLNVKAEGHDSASVTSPRNTRLPAASAAMAQPAIARADATLRKRELCMIGYINVVKQKSETI